MTDVIDTILMLIVESIYVAACLMLFVVSLKLITIIIIDSYFFLLPGDIITAVHVDLHKLCRVGGNFKVWH